MRCVGDRANVDDIYTGVIGVDVYYLVASEVSSKPLDHQQMVLFVHGVSHAFVPESLAAVSLRMAELVSLKRQ